VCTVPRDSRAHHYRQRIPLRILDIILLSIRRAGIVESERGPDGAYWLARRAEDISLAQVIRAVDLPLANLRGRRPEHYRYRPAAEPLQDIWIFVAGNERKILDLVKVANVASGELPSSVRSCAGGDGTARLNSSIQSGIRASANGCGNASATTRSTHTSS
jgi:DNA-binding IscR family transcriptional regulator